MEIEDCWLWICDVKWRGSRLLHCIVLITGERHLATFPSLLCFALLIVAFCFAWVCFSLLWSALTFSCLLCLAWSLFASSQSTTCCNYLSTLCCNSWHCVWLYANSLNWPDLILLDCTCICSVCAILMHPSYCVLLCFAVCCLTFFWGVCVLQVYFHLLHSALLCSLCLAAHQKNFTILDRKGSRLICW